MEKALQIKIVGIDERRPPIVRKEPYIDLNFRLSEEPPAEWLEDFRRSTAKMTPAVNFSPKGGFFIETYVRNMQEIPACLGALKAKLTECNSRYAERLLELTRSQNAQADKLRGQEAGPQGQLNKIIAALDFDSPPT